MAFTPKQKEILQFLSHFGDENGYAPTLREIAEHFRFSSLGTVQYYLAQLEAEGLLKKGWNKKRDIHIHAPEIIPPRTVFLPLAGRVAAGRPISAIETSDDIEVPPSMLKRGEHIVLKVQGQSMIDDGIHHEDYLIVKKQKTAENGQTVVALINNEATVKRFFKFGDRIELHAANPAFKNLIVGKDDHFEIEGVVAGVIRKLT